MTTITGRLIPITDEKGEILLDEESLGEPLPGSVVMTQGRWGTAWQLFFSDDRWHPTRGGGSKTWDDLLKQRNLVLVYDAEVRVEANPEARR